jgi:hypothetical protein
MLDTLSVSSLVSVTGGQTKPFPNDGITGGMKVPNNKVPGLDKLSTGGCLPPWMRSNGPLLPAVTIPKGEHLEPVTSGSGYGSGGYGDYAFGGPWGDL